MFDYKNECKECGQTFKTMDPFGRHLNRKHHMSLQEYYDKWFKEPGEGICLTCGKPTPFSHKLRIGYKKYCCNSCVGSNDEIQRKKAKTTFEHYGVENPHQSEEIKEQCKQTLLERYGVDHPLKSEEIKEKVRETFNTKYGDWISRIDSLKEKSKQTQLERYGDEFYTRTDEYRKRRKETCLKKYGTEHPMQNSEIFKKTKRKFEYDGISFDSKWEAIYYQYLKKHNIKFEYQPNVKLEYEYENVKHIYKPDFRLDDGTLVEIKGTQFFKDGKMINPWDHSKDGLFEAKHQCMKRNNVKIILNIKEYMEQI
jgi:hypothetical protein